MIQTELGDIFPYLNILGWILITITTLTILPIILNAIIQTYQKFINEQDPADFKLPTFLISIFFNFFLAIGPWLALAFFVFEDDFIEFPIYHVIGLVVAFFLFILLLPGVYGSFRFIGKLIRDFRNAGPTRGVIENITSELKNGKKIILTCIVLNLLGIIPVSVIGSNTIIGHILITPQDYTAQFAFWGSHYHTRYTTTQLEELDQYGAIIAPYTVGALITESERTDFINEMIWWKNNYPNVKFLPAVLGIPGLFVWDGAENTTKLAKEIAQLVLDNSLTNVIGLSFDWERPVESDLHGISDAPNRTRHEESIARWNEFFDWMEDNAPQLITSCINYVGMSQDTIDGDFDLHYLECYNTFEVPRWDEYAPMIYRCGYKGTRPYGDYPTWPSSISVPTTYDFYRELKAHVDGVKRVHGNTDRAGVYIGITNCTCYGDDVEVYEFGEYLGKGFDVLVRDALICKHFGIPTITIFILSTEIENGYSMGGVFDSYGDDFLDRFNEAVNGPESTTPFSIPIGSIDVDSAFLPEGIRNYLMDYLYNLDSLIGFIGISLVLIIFSFMIVRKTWKKK